MTFVKQVTHKGKRSDADYERGAVMKSKKLLSTAGDNHDRVIIATVGVEKFCSYLQRSKSKEDFNVFRLANITAVSDDSSDSSLEKYGSTWN